jgi:hypothetical protein
VDTGSREENASKQKIRASVLIQSEPKRLSSLIEIATPRSDGDERCLIRSDNSRRR